MKRRIATTVIGAVVLALLLAGLGTLALSRASARRAATEELQRQAGGIAQVVSTLAALAPADSETARDPEAPLQGRISRRTLGGLQRRFEVEDIGLTLIRPNQDAQQQLPGSIRWSAEDIAALTGGGDAAGHTRTGLPFGAAGRPIGESVIVVTLVGDRSTPLANGFGWFLLTSAGIIVLAGFASVRLGSRLARPIQEATNVTSRIATGDLSARLPEPDASTTDESAVLARSINSMADTLQRSKGLEQQFLLSISHDLRTPLTSIKGYAEAITDGATDDPRAAAEVIATETRRLERLVRDLLDLAHLDAHQFALHPAPADVAALVAAAAQSLLPRVRRAGLRLELRSAGPARAMVDGDRVMQVVGNLVANAIGFARSTIVVETSLTGVDSSAAETSPRHVVVSVSDDGPGITSEDLDHVFERLYRSQQQPERRESNSGLGLAIVRELVAAMGGDVGADSPSTGGTTVWFRLPLDGSDQRKPLRA